MGCANAKPESHTKKQPLKPGPSGTKPANLNSSFQNPETKNQQQSIQNKNPVPPLNVSSNFNTSTSKQSKIGFEDLQKNPTFTKSQVKAAVLEPQKEVKRVENSVVKEVVEQPTTLSQTPIRKVQHDFEKKPQALPPILQRKEESEVTKKPALENSSSFKVFQSNSNQRNSPSGIQFSGIPDMDENFMVSNITKKNQSAEKLQNLSIQNTQNVSASKPQKIHNQAKQTLQNFSAQKPENQSVQKLQKLSASKPYNQSNSKINAQSGSKINPTNTQQNFPDKNLKLSLQKAPQHPTKKQEQQQQSFSQIQNERSRQQNAITTEDIKVNIRGHDIKLVDDSFISDEFTALPEEHFDLNCSFDPTTLVVDMNKVAW